MPRRGESRSATQKAEQQDTGKRPRRRAIGALWRNTAKQTGEKYLRGHLDLGALGRIQVVVFVNRKRKEGGAENQPDYRILLSTPLGDGSKAK